MLFNHDSADLRPIPQPPARLSPGDQGGDPSGGVLPPLSERRLDEAWVVDGGGVDEGAAVAGDCPLPAA